MSSLSVSNNIDFEGQCYKDCLFKQLTNHEGARRLPELTENILKHKVTECDKICSLFS